MDIYRGVDTDGDLTIRTVDMPVNRSVYWALTRTFHASIHWMGSRGGATMTESNYKAAQDLTQFMETKMQDLQSKFQARSDQLVSRVDEMGTRIDNLEKNVADLMTQAGMEKPQTSK